MVDKKLSIILHLKLVLVNQMLKQIYTDYCETACIGLEN